MLDAEKPQWQKLQEVQELHSKISQKNAIMKQTLSNQVPVYYVLKALSELIPQYIYFRRLTIKEQATVMEIEGIVLETNETAEVTLANFIKTLEDSDFFNSFLLDSTQDVEISKRKALEFKISCKLGKN